MCDFCSCRSMPVIEDLDADHESLLAIGPSDWDAIEQAAATERAHAG